MQKLDLSNTKTAADRLEEVKEERNNAREQIKQLIRLDKYLKPAPNHNGNTGYCCPLCKSGTHRGRESTGAVEYFPQTNTAFCYSCRRPVDVFDALREQTGADYSTVLSLLAQEAGIDLQQPADKKKTITADQRERYKQAAQSVTQSNAKSAGDAKQDGQNKTPAEGAQSATGTSPADYTAYYEQCRERLKEPAAIKYLNSRWITFETAAEYGIGYDPAADPANVPGATGNEKKVYPCPRIIIPCSKSYYVARSIEPNAKLKAPNPKGSKAALFNAEALDSPAEVIFITEGVFDALSFLQAGEQAIALNSKGNSALLLQRLQEKPAAHCPAFVVVPDNDSDPETNADTQERAAELKAGLQSMGYPAIVYNAAGEYKDANAALVADQDAFEKRTEDARRAALQAEIPAEEPAAEETPADGKEIAAESAALYLTSGAFEKDIAYFQEYKGRKIGYPAIDQYLTLYPGLAALGGASSLGKTTFVVNIIDKLLANGETVLYFSLEQLPIEIITKSLARMIREKDPFTRLTNIDIKNGGTSEQLESVKQEYAKTIENYHIITGDFRTTAADIVKQVEQFRSDHGGDSCKPVVIIDYLQLIAAPDNFRGGIREATDENIKALKDMQKRNGLFVLMISNFNRASNYEPVSYESFKETSMIEYTCDYIWGLQLAILDAENIDFYTVKGAKGGRSERPIDQKRKLVNDAQGKIPKQVEFVSLKNRNGKQFFKAFFEYYPQNDLFVAIGKDGFRTNYGDNPFSDDEKDKEIVARI